MMGHRASDIVIDYPHMYSQIMTLMKFRPPRLFKTQVLHIWGPTGVGKTTLIHKILESYKEHRVDYYSKCGGLSKFWDGYDNQEIAWIDDPVTMNAAKDKETIQHLKNIFSTGHCQIEVKYGTMVFDSKIVIITSNAGPRAIANSCGESAEPIFRRLIDTCGSYHFHMKGQREKLENYVYACLDKVLNKGIDVSRLKEKQPKIKNIYY